MSPLFSHPEFYTDEATQSWLLKPKYLVEGIIYEYEDEDELEDHIKAKHVPKESIIATLEGNWRGEVVWKKVGDKVGRAPSFILRNTEAGRESRRQRR